MNPCFNCVRASTLSTFSNVSTSPLSLPPYILMPADGAVLPVGARILKALSRRAFAPREGRSAHLPPLVGGAEIRFAKSVLLSARTSRDGQLHLRYRNGFEERIPRPDPLAFAALPNIHADVEAFLYTDILRDAASVTIPRRPAPAALRGNPNDTSNVIAFLPAELKPLARHLLSLAPIRTVVTSRAATVLGTCRAEADEHIIRIGMTGSPWRFAVTLLHELAHAFAPRTAAATGHDAFWKLTFENFLIDAYPLFPAQARPYLDFLIVETPSRTDLEQEKRCLDGLAHG